MKKIQKIDLKQKMIASLVTCILIFNFIVPPRSEAIWSEIADTFQSLVCWIDDAIINGLQKFFMGETAIFETYADYQQKINQENLDNAEGLFGNLLASCGVFFGSTTWGANIQGWISGDKANYKGPVALIRYSIPNIVSNQIPAFDINFFKAGKIDTTGEENGKKSTATELKTVVQKWYYAFRNLALIALLSILLYLGIKIVLSSTAGEKAKYKENIKNWVMAVVLLFSLHYIMAFTLNIIDEVNKVLTKSIDVKQMSSVQIDTTSEAQTESTQDNESTQYDNFIGSIRVAAEVSDGYTDNLVYTLMYTVLMVYIIIFTVMYFKRTIYIVFLTMIAPLVAVTYPIDKEKDGKSQAFDMWMKEYFFNALLQPIHLILYYVLVGSAQELVKDNPLYAIVAIGFMIPAENLIRKMFGMENVGKASALTGFAGGALASSAIKKLKSAGSKGSSKKGNSSNGNEKTSENSNIKMAKMDDVFNSEGGNNPIGGSLDKNGINTARSNFDGNNQVENNLGGINLGRDNLSENKSDGNTNAAKQTATRMQQFRNAVNNKIESNPALRGGAAIGQKVFTRKNAVKGAKALAKGAVKASAIGTGAMLGVAAGIASGDLSKAIQYAGTGAAAGLGASNLTIKGAKTLGTSAINLGKNVKETYQKGYYDSEEEYQKKVLIPKLKEKNEKDKELQKKYKKAGIDMAESTGRTALYNAGYVNEEEILKALKIQQKSGASDKELVQNAIMSKQIGKFSDVSAVQEELYSRLEKSGLDTTKAKQEAERRMKDIKKMAGLT